MYEILKQKINYIMGQWIYCFSWKTINLIYFPIEEKTLEKGYNNVGQNI